MTANTPIKLELFCKSFQDDLGLLKAAILSFCQHLHGPWKMTVVLDRGNKPPTLESDRIKYLFVQPWGDGYCHAMATKMCADLYCPEADILLLFDSDMELASASALDQLLDELGRPRVWWQDWDSADPVRQVARRVWVPAVYRSTGQTLDRDWMVAPTWLWWPSTFRRARRLVELHTQLPFLQAVYSTHPYNWQKFLEHPMTLCDIELLGLSAHEFEPAKYAFLKRDAVTACQFPDRIRQGWSHTAATKANERKAAQ